jgi:hypothetical protein
MDKITTLSDLLEAEVDESHHHTVGVAQLAEHLTVTQEAAGSSPVTHPKTFIQRLIEEHRENDPVFREAYDEEVALLQKGQSEASL